MNNIKLRDLEEELDYHENQHNDSALRGYNEIYRFIFERFKTSSGDNRSHYKMLLNITSNAAERFYPQLNKPEENA